MYTQQRQNQVFATSAKMFKLHYLSMHESTLIFPLKIKQKYGPINYYENPPWDVC
jgi:hypothetical protein